jgi:hypothetical protein
VFIPDLQRLEPGHCRHPSTVPVKLDGHRMGVLPPGDIVQAVGWLEDIVPSKGPVPGEVIATLFDHHTDAHWFSDFSRGFHTCGLGDENAGVENNWLGFIVRWHDRKVEVSGHGHFLIAAAAGETYWRPPPLFRRMCEPATQRHIYIFPALLLHYIVDHGYRPPDIFLDAVRRGRFLGPADLVPCDEQF